MIIFLLSPGVGFAQSGNVTGGDRGEVTGQQVTSTQLDNPLKGSGDLYEFFTLLLNIIMVFALPLIVLFIIFAGFQYVMARGNPEAISKANRALLYAVIGGVIILGAKIILEVIKGTVAAF